MNDGEWKLTCVGTLERIERQDIDKTMRHPKIKLVLHVRPSEMQAEREGVEMPELVRFGIMERDFLRMVDELPEEGALIAVEGIATGVRPVLCTLSDVSIITEH